MGKIRCPLRPASTRLDRSRPEILQPPEHPQAGCTQQTITVPAEVNAKTRQKHDYPSAAWRRSYARRTGAERAFATAKDPASNDIARGWCRLMGLAPLMLFVTTLLVVRNQRILHAWNNRQQENARRAAKGLPPKPGAGAAEPSAQSPLPSRPSGNIPGNTATAPSSTAPRQRQYARKPARPSAKQPDEHKPHTTRQQPACAPECQAQT